MLTIAATIAGSARRALGQILALHRTQRHKINWLLAGILRILALTLAARPAVTTYSLEDLEKLAKATGLFRDVASVVAVSVAGLWSYYVSAKGRTFAPRAKLQIALHDISSHHGAAIIRFTVTNIGRTKLSSLKGRARYFIGEGTSQGTIFIPMYLDKDVLRHYREPGTSLILEPGDEINIDTPLLIKDFSQALLLVKSVFEVNDRRAYKENAIFASITLELPQERRRNLMSPIAEVKKLFGSEPELSTPK